MPVIRYFISDLHLNKQPMLINGFISWLNALKDADELYILGDFFDLWLGDDFIPSEFDRVNSALKQYTDQGGQLFFMPGNRDFLVGKHWCSSVGATLLPDVHSLTLLNEHWLLLHGDTLCTDDVDYQKMRTLFRNPEFQQSFLKQSIKQRQAYANRIRTDSKTAQTSKTESIMDVNQQAVDQLMLKHNSRRIIHGHTHRPYVHQGSLNTPLDESQPYWRYVLGDWTTTQGWMIRANDSQVVLQTFKF